MREFAAPFTVYVTSDFADGKPGLWWIGLERALTNADSVKTKIGSVTIEADCRSLAAKEATFVRLRNALVVADSISACDAINQLCDRQAIDYATLTGELCMSWDELKRFSGDPLVTIGSHSLSHGNIAKMTPDGARWAAAIRTSKASPPHGLSLWRQERSRSAGICASL